MRDWYCIVGGQQYGPVAFEVLRTWAAEGRLKPADHVWTEGMAQWFEARCVEGLFAVSAAAGPPVAFVKAHRGPVVLTLGILGIIPCLFVCGIVAWVMANTDLREMRAGRMDRSGEGITQAGKICGIIGFFLALAAILVWVLWLLSLLLMAGTVFSAAAGVLARPVPGP